MGHRSDIQLLRAFAVIIVVLYHLEMPFFSKGFLGVDVFFVISGFLMAVLYQQGRPLEFFKRRVRRLLPPYVAVLLSTMVVGLVLLYPNELDQLTEQSLYSAFFSANLWFWSENSYFSSSGFRPLLHLWTLGVEAQYYLFVPLIMWFFFMQKWSLLVLAAGSLALCALMLYVSPKTSFFMMPLRAWEFLLGAMAALYLTRQGAVRNKAYGWLGLVGAGGLLAVQFIPVNGVALNMTLGHPGLTAFLACSATMIVLVFGLPDRLLRHQAVQPLLYIGNVSYSAYLVHFPIIVFYFYEPFSGTVLSRGNPVDTAVLLVMIVVASLLCYHLVEKPGPKLNQRMLATAGASAVFLLVTLNGVVISKRFDNYELGFLMANTDRAPYRCGKIARIIAPSAQTCLLRSNGIYNDAVLLVGNSHADSIKTSFSFVADSHGYHTYFVVANNPLMPNGMTVSQVLDEALAKNIKTIVTHHSPGAVIDEDYLELYRVAAERGINLFVIAPIPIYDRHVPKAIHEAYKTGMRELTLQTRQEHVHRINGTLQLLQEVSGQYPDSLSYYDPSVYLCDEHCRLMAEDGRAWYFDDGHLTLSGAQQLEPLFNDIFTRLQPQ